ncbi:MAG: YgcG family protein [Sulfuricaulis sp.]|nr:YgcG family protein [Sulfuricaulis sp.]
MARKYFHILCVLCVFAVSLACAEVAVPPLAARVTDLTGTLAPSQRDTLERELQAFESRKGSQIAVLIVPTTQPEEIEQYSIRVADAWKLGRKGIQDGVILLIAKDDRALRIEVGYGLEGVIPDAVGNRIVNEIIVPFFKQGDFYGGIHAGVNRLIRLIDGEPLPPPAARDRSWAGLRDLLPFGFIAVLIGGGLLRALFGRMVGAGVAGGVVAVVAWIMLGSLLTALVAAIMVFLFVLMAGVRMGPSGYGGWGGGMGGGGFGGGGFSGGGGGFGGGGASGKW